MARGRRALCPEGVTGRAGPVPGRGYGAGAGSAGVAAEYRTCGEDSPAPSALSVHETARRRKCSVWLVERACERGELVAWKEPAANPRNERGWVWAVDPRSVARWMPRRAFVHTVSEAGEDREAQRTLERMSGGLDDGSVMPCINALANRQRALYRKAGDRVPRSGESGLTDAEILELSRIRVELADLWEVRRRELARDGESGRFARAWKSGRD